MTDKPTPTGAQAIERAIDMLRLVSSRTIGGIRLSEAVRLSGLSKSTAFRLLTTLKDQGFLEQDEGSGNYFLGPDAYAIGIAAATRHGLHASAVPHLERLAKATGDTCFLTIRRHNHSVCLSRVEGAYPVRSHVLQVGDRHPLGLGAGSLAILATLADDEITRILADNEEEVRTTYPQATDAIVWRDVGLARAQGFALNPGRFAAGSWGIGVAVGDAGKPAQIALSISAIEPRLADGRSVELADALHKAADRLHREIGTTSLT